MKSKEEILKGNITGYRGAIKKTDAYKSMDEYAKQIAVLFHKWVAKNYWHMGDNEWMETESDKRYTAEELYEEYLKVVNK